MFVIVYIILMHKTKLDYLNEEIKILKRQNYKLQCMLSEQSEDASKSLLFQLKQENQQLHNKIQQLNDELLLQKQSRLIERTTHQQSIEQYNSIIFQFKEQVKKYQSILKQQPTIQQELGIFQKWARSKIGISNNQMFHKYADPILFFNILQEVLSLKQEDNETVREEMPYNKQIDKSTTSFKVQKKQQSKWFQQQSQIYFMRKNRQQNLRLNLKKAKLVQMNFNRAIFKETKQQQPLGNHKLLKNSYVNLIIDYQKLRKKVVLYQKYIQELQNRNKLLIQSNILN